MSRLGELLSAPQPWLTPRAIPLSRALIDAICHDHPFAIPWPQLHWPP
jgi:hypothetical protein